MNSEQSTLRVSRPFATVLRLSSTALVGLTLAACNSAPAGIQPGTISNAPVVGQGFRLVLPSGWSAGAPTVSNGYTTYAVKPATGGLDVTVATLAIPTNSTDPSVAAVMNDDIATLALTINGTSGAPPQLTEQAHVVSFVGESCARMGLATGVGGDSRSITCRRNRVIYVVAVSSGSTGSQLLPTLDAIGAAWSWT